MTLEKTIFTVLILAAFGFAAYTWKESHADRVSLEKAIAIQQQIIDAAETKEQSRDANLKTTLSRMAAANRAVRTPQQIINELQQYLDLPEPITLGVKSTVEQPKPGKGIRQSKIGDLSETPEVATALDSKQDEDRVQPLPPGAQDAVATVFGEPPPSAPKQSVPATRNLKSEILDFFKRKFHPRDSIGTPPNHDSTLTTDVVNPSLDTEGGASIPSADLKPLFDEIQTCRWCEAQLTVSQADLEDEKTRSAALAKERDAALASAKGGSFWHRLKQNAKWLAIGAAVAAGASRIR